MIESAQKAYLAKYGGAAELVKVRELPSVGKSGPYWSTIFFWKHVGMVRHHGRRIPTKPRRKLRPEEWADLKRELEVLVHQARHALAYLEKMT